MKPLITSILYNDLYAFTTSQMAHTLYPNVICNYRVIFRDKSITFPDGFDTLLKEQIEWLTLAQLKVKEFDHLVKYRFFNENYLEWLASYVFDPTEVSIHQSMGYLDIEISGEWDRTILWEAPLLELITALYYKRIGINPDNLYLDRAESKADFIAKKKLSVVEGGTRRAFSPEVHRDVYMTMKTIAPELKTSNVALAMETNDLAIGTYGHQIPMFFSALYGVEEANNEAMKAWYNFYHNHQNLHTALTDTYKTDFFYKTVDEEFLAKYKKFRIDSGDPLEMAWENIDNLKTVGIDPKSKILIFSDSLNPQYADKINQQVKNDVESVSFIIGGNITNDVGAPRFDVVQKPMSFDIPYSNPHNGITIYDNVAVCKISDTEGKQSGPQDSIERAMKIIKGYKM